MNKSTDASDRFFNMKKQIDNYKDKPNTTYNVINKQELS